MKKRESEVGRRKSEGGSAFSRGGGIRRDKGRESEAEICAYLRIKAGKCADLRIMGKKEKVPNSQFSVFSRDGRRVQKDGADSRRRQQTKSNQIKPEKDFSIYFSRQGQKWRSCPRASAFAQKLPSSLCFDATSRRDKPRNPKAQAVARRALSLRSPKSNGRLRILTRFDLF